MSIKEKMESTKTFYKFGCRNEKDIYTFMEISESNWYTLKSSKSFSTDNLDAVLNTPVNKYFAVVGFALKLAYSMKDNVPEDLYKASLSTLKSWFNSEDPDKWTLPSLFSFQD